jgi:hypothetical protein
MSKMLRKASREIYKKEAVLMAKQNGSDTKSHLSILFPSDLDEKLNRYLMKNPETDRSKTVRQAVREFLNARLPEEPKRGRVKTA